MSCPQPTPQYGQIDRATCASSIRACIARVFSDIDSRPVPSLRSRICRTSGHFERTENIRKSSRAQRTHASGLGRLQCFYSRALNAEAWFAREFEACQASRARTNIFFQREHLKNATEHFRMEQGLQLACCLRRIRQERLARTDTAKFGHDY